MSNQFSNISLHWIDNGNEYIAETPYGRAIITEIQEIKAKLFSFGAHNYQLRLDYVNGQTETIYHIFDSLSEAEGWAYLSFQDYVSKRREQDELDDLLATLDLCRKSILPEINKGNAEKINRIEFIIKNYFEQKM